MSCEKELEDVGAELEEVMAELSQVRGELQAARDEADSSELTCRLQLDEFQEKLNDWDSIEGSLRMRVVILATDAIETVKAAARDLEAIGSRLNEFGVGEAIRDWAQRLLEAEMVLDRERQVADAHLRKMTEIAISRASVATVAKLEARADDAEARLAAMGQQESTP